MPTPDLRRSLSVKKNAAAAPEKPCSFRWMLFLVLVVLAVQSIKASTGSSGHYSFTTSSTNMSVLCAPATFGSAPTINGIPLSPGDELAAFDSAGHCIGSTRWNGVSANVPIMGYDSTAGTVTHGLHAGQTAQFRIWDSSAALEVATVRVHFAQHGTYSGTTINSDSIYVANGIAAFDTFAGSRTYPAPAVVLPLNWKMQDSVVTGAATGAQISSSSYSASSWYNAVVPGTVLQTLADLPDIGPAPIGLVYREAPHRLIVHEFGAERRALVLHALRQERIAECQPGSGP